VLAKTAYWRGATEFRNTHDSSVFQGLAGKVWPEMLAALPHALTLPVDNPVRVVAVREARGLLAGALFGKKLPPALKKKIVSEFIDPISKDSDGPASWAVVQKARVFRNLGIGDRLEFHLPNPLPANDLPTLLFVEAVKERHVVPFQKAPQQSDYSAHWAARQSPAPLQQTGTGGRLARWLQRLFSERVCRELLPTLAGWVDWRRRRRFLKTMSFRNRRHYRPISRQPSSKP
jgi:hypothetical protein